MGKTRSWKPWRVYHAPDGRFWLCTVIEYGIDPGGRVRFIEVHPNVGNWTTTGKEGVVSQRRSPRSLGWMYVGDAHP